MKDYYAVLGTDSDATAGALKNAYRRKASEFHPDRNTAPDAPARFRDIQEAYDLLSDAVETPGIRRKPAPQLAGKPA